MISKSQQKYVQSLHNKKQRQLNAEFLVEGSKNVHELLTSGWHISALYYTPRFAHELPAGFAQGIEVTEAELAKITTLQSNNAAVAVVKTPQQKIPQDIGNQWVIATDNLNDPGNLGTIIRIADWYGIQHLFLSENSVEVYNPKVIMATMGSFTRVAVHYVPLAAWLQAQHVPVYGATLTGQHLHTFSPPQKGILLIGSESHGISDEALASVTHQLTIPRIGRAESLNAGVATAILLDNLVQKLP